MDSLLELLPKSKFDDSNIERLSQLSTEQMKPLIGSLLSWLQDMNWPIAKKVLPVIAEHQEIAMPHVSSVLSGCGGYDWLWIYWILQYLFPLLKEQNVQLVKSELEFLSSLKGTDEDSMEIVRLSKEYLAMLAVK